MNSKIEPPTIDEIEGEPIEGNPIEGEPIEGKPIVISIIEFCTSLFSISKELCIQILLIIIVTILYINYNNDNYSDSLIYFTFGAFIAINFVATIVLIIKREIIIDKLVKKVDSKYFSLHTILYFFITFFIKENKENKENKDSRQLITYLVYNNIFLHIVLLLIVCYYVKSYILHSKKTEYAYLVSLCYAIVFFLFNIYVIDICKRYKRKIEFSTNETTKVILSLFITYAIVLYYFETIKLTQTS